MQTTNVEFWSDTIYNHVELYMILAELKIYQYAWTSSRD